MVRNLYRDVVERTPLDTYHVLLTNNHSYYRWYANRLELLPCLQQFVTTLTLTAFPFYP